MLHTVDPTVSMTPAATPKLRELSFRPRDLWRVHPLGFEPDQPYTTPEQETYFGPIHRKDGSPIPLLHATTCLPAVLWATAFHDVPAERQAEYLLDFSNLERSDLCVSCIRPHGRLRLMQFSGIGFAPPGVQREAWKQLPVLAYRESRSWVSRCYAATTAQGLLWTMPEFDETGRACYGLLLFGDRIRQTRFTTKIDREPLCSGKVLRSIVELAERSGIGGIYGV